MNYLYFLYIEFLAKHNIPRLFGDITFYVIPATIIFIALLVVILALVLKTCYKDVETNAKYHKKERYFQQAEHAAISSAIASTPDSVDLSKENNGNAIKLDIYYSKATGKAYIQLFEYVPYTYQPCSKMYEYEISKVGKLIK